MIQSLTLSNSSPFLLKYVFLLNSYSSSPQLFTTKQNFLFHKMASSSSSSSSSSTDSITNPLTAIILHPHITLPSVIPSQISQKFTDFTAFRNFPNPFTKIPSWSSTFTQPLLPLPNPLQIVDVDDLSIDRYNLPIADLIPRSLRSQLNKNPPPSLLMSKILFLRNPP